jgi:mRNA interferase RelE/StbE
MTDPGRYSIRIKRSAEKEMDTLTANVFERVTEAILSLEANPRPLGSKKLRGVDEYRLRVGDYRVLYLVNDVRRIVEIMAVGHRRDVYRKR